MAPCKVLSKQCPHLSEGMSREVILLLLGISERDAVKLVQRELEGIEHLRIVIVELKSKIPPFRSPLCQDLFLRRAYLISSSTARSVGLILIKSFRALCAILDIVKWGSE